MKKIIYILLCAAFLFGCIKPGNLKQENAEKGNNLITESFLPFEEEQKQDKKTDISKTDESADAVEKKVNAEDFNEEVKADLMRKQQERYYFSNLEITQQNLYVEILYALENYVEGMKVSAENTEEIDQVFQCVLMDHPEIFYVEGYSFVKYTLGDEIQKILFKGTYTYTKEEKRGKEALVEEAALSMLAGISANATDYEKVKYVYETIIAETEYDMEATDNQNICSVFLNKSSVCQGYAKAVQYLLLKLNVPATLIIGTVETGEGHAWNMVMVNRDYYYLDATWGDASYLLQKDGEMQEGQGRPTINYDYLCVTTEEIMRTHSMKELVALPVCDSMEANYYVREGAYFTEVNHEQLRQLFEIYQEENRDIVTLRCANETVFSQMTEELLTKQKIFKYLEGNNNSIIYADSPKQRSITFWL